MHISSMRTLSYLPCQWAAFLALLREHLAEFFAAGASLKLSLLSPIGIPLRLGGQRNTFYVGNLFKLKQVFELK